MKKSWLAVAFALAFSVHFHLASAQITSNATGGAGGQGGAAQGGTATGGAATNSNTVNSAGGSGGVGGTGGTSSAQGGTSTATGGTSSATGIQTGPINGTGNNQAAEVTVNYIQPSAPGGIKGLAAGVDPNTNAIVYDNNINYSGTYKIKNTPDVSVGGPASGPCNGFSGGVGVSVPGFALGANASTVDKGCEARETARVAAMLGRMDLANAVLEHISVVEEALKAKAAREAAAKQAAAMATPARAAPAAQPNISESEMEVARLQEQQRLAVAALQRGATMNKLNDNLTFTNAAMQAKEKTPQQVMAEEATKEQAEKAARIEKQQQLERQLVALKSAPVDKPLNALAPEVSTPKLALTKVAAVPAAASPSPAQTPATNAQTKPRETAAAPASEKAKVASQAQPRTVSIDNVAEVLGFGSAQVRGGSATPSIPVAADTQQKKTASETVVAQQQATKRVVAADRNAADNGSKAPGASADSVSAAKGVLNFK